jgi:zinc protease
MRAHIALAVLLAACGPKEPPPPPPAPPVDPLAEKPGVGTPPDWTPPAAETLSLDNGADAWLVSRDDLPLVSVRLWIPGGTLAGPEKHPGLVVLTDTLLMHGAGDRDGAEFAAHAEQLAISLEASTWERGTVVSLDCHADRLDEGLELMADAVLRPRFARADVQRERDLQISEIERALDDPRTVASWVSYAQWYGEGHPSAIPGEGTVKGLKGVSEKTVRADWARRSSPVGARFIVTGAVGAEDLKGRLDTHFGAWKGKEKAAPEFPPAAGVTDGPRYVMVDAPGSSQSVLRVILPGHPVGAEADVPTRLGAIVLGGTFTSRLNRLLREEKGYTYGARARHASGPDDGLLMAYTNVRGDVTGAALKDLLGELEKAAAGVDEAERTKAIGAARTDAVEGAGTRSSLAGALLSATADGLGPDALQQDLAAVTGTDEAAIDAALSTVDLSRALIVVVGDLSAVREEVEAAVPAEWEVVTP